MSADPESLEYQAGWLDAYDARQPRSKTSREYREGYAAGEKSRARHTSPARVANLKAEIAFVRARNPRVQ